MEPVSNFVKRVAFFLAFTLLLSTGSLADGGLELKGLSISEEYTLHVLKQYDPDTAARLRRDFRKDPTQGGRLRALKKAYKSVKKSIENYEGLLKTGVANETATKATIKARFKALQIIERFFGQHVKFYKEKRAPNYFGDHYSYLLYTFDNKKAEWNKKRAELRKTKPRKTDQSPPGKKKKKASGSGGEPSGGQDTVASNPLTSLDSSRVFSNPLSGVFPGGLKLSLDLATSSTEPNFDLDTNFGSYGGGGEDTLTSIGVDARGTFGRLPNLPVSFLAGAWGRINLGGEEQNRLSLDLHPTVGLDTFAYLVTNGFAMPYFGVSTGFLNFANTDTDVDLSLYTGLRVESRTLTLRTDESGGGGTPNKFRKTKTQANVTIGGDVDIKPGNLPVFFRFGAAVDFNSSMKVTGRSAVNGNTYELETGSQPVYRMIFGVGLPL